MLSFGNGLRLAARRLGRAPMFTGVTLLTLAIGIGANTAIFSVIDAVLLRPLPYSGEERLVGVWHKAPAIGQKLNASASSYVVYREENRVFEDIALWNDGACTVTELGEPERVDSLYVTHALLPLLRVGPAMGREFQEKDEDPKSPDTVMLSHGYWQRKFGADPGILGRRILADGKAREIIGVLPRGFRFLDVNADLLFPIRIERSELTVGSFMYQSIARLKPGVTLAQANADMARMIPVTMDRFPFPSGLTRQMFESLGLGPNIHPLKEDLVGEVGKVLWVLMATVGIVLLIACANVANLFLVRAEGRQQELTLRAALGAGWGRIARELLIESIGLALAGGALGVGLAYAGLRLLVFMAPANLPRLASVGIDGRALLFTLVVTLAAGALCGLIPVFKFARANLSAALREGGRSLSGGKARYRARNLLAVAQIALSLVLLIGAGLMMRSFQALRHVSPGFQASGTLTFRAPIQLSNTMTPDAAARTHQRILERIRQIPGVSSAGAMDQMVMGKGDHNPIFVEEFPASEAQRLEARTYKFVTPGLFGTLGVPLLAGRDLDWNDVLIRRRPVVVVSENFALRYWKTPAQALGKRIRNAPAAAWREIVGVVGNEHEEGLDRPEPQMIYFPVVVDNLWSDEPMTRSSLAYAVRSPRTGEPAFLEEIRRAVREVNPGVPITNVTTLQKILDRSTARTSFTLVMLGIASVMALLLGLVGVYGVIAYSVSQRTREIGIRMALGAGHSVVRGIFVREGLLLAGGGLVLGLAGSFALTRWMAALLYGVTPTDPATYAGVALILTAATMLASYVPARRATAVDPVETLRAE